METPSPTDQTTLATVFITVASVIGATGLAALLKVWVENKRLTNKDYRASLLERIEQLEKVQAELYSRLEALGTRNGELRAEVKFLRNEDYDNPESSPSRG